MSVSELKSGFAISQPAISQHLAALRGAGLVCERREGRFAYYRAEPQALAPLIDWVDRGGRGFTDRGVSGFLPVQYSNRR
jgi:DNA-binding transcriptional ArsR family regulator